MLRLLFMNTGCMSYKLYTSEMQCVFYKQGMGQPIPDTGTKGADKSVPCSEE